MAGPRRRMAEDPSLEARVDAIERTLTDGTDVEGLPEAARIESRVEDLEATADDVEERLAELEAAVQALRGFAGGVRAVDESVERRANAALAAVERLEDERRGTQDPTTASTATPTADANDDRRATGRRSDDDPGSGTGRRPEAEGGRAGAAGVERERDRTTGRSTDGRGRPADAADRRAADTTERRTDDDLATAVEEAADGVDAPAAADDGDTGLAARLRRIL
jgi:uncharacterized protein YoxC